MEFRSALVEWHNECGVASGSDAVFGSTAGVVQNDVAVTVDDITFTAPFSATVPPICIASVRSPFHLKI
jgi:hypothetical protein